MDRDLPGNHGDTICKMITDSDDPAMVVMLTAADTPADQVSGLGLGADDSLPKPFHFPELVLRLRALVRRKPTAQPRTLKAADLALDPLRRTASGAGPAVRTDPQGVRRARSAHASLPGRPQQRRPPRTGLGRPHRPFTKTVQVNIGRLRRKLGDPDMIETIPGVGYGINYRIN